MVARYFPLAGGLLVCHARAVCQCGLCETYVSTPADKELPVWGSQAEGQMWAGHSACTCKVHLLDQRDLLQCMKTRDLGLGAGGGEGSGRSLHSFHSYVRLTRQTLAAVPRCCVMSQAGLQAMQADSNLLDWEQSSLGVLLCWEAQGPWDSAFHLVHLPHYCSTSHLQERYKAHQWSNWLWNHLLDDLWRGKNNHLCGREFNLEGKGKNTVCMEREMKIFDWTQSKLGHLKLGVCKGAKSSGGTDCQNAAKKPLREEIAVGPVNGRKRWAGGLGKPHCQCEGAVKISKEGATTTGMVIQP